MGTFTRGPMWLQLAQHLLLFWLIHYSEATPFKETTEVADPSSLGCYYNYNHYSEGDRILTNEPCLNCTCHNKMLMCYLRVCPFTKPIGQDCTIEKREDQCCPIITCPEVPVELVDHSSGLHSTSLAMPDRYGCHINNQFYAEGSQIPSNPKKPCELCYCIRNMTSCVMQECTLHVEGCSPIYNRDVCCPVRYDCGRESIDEELLLEESTTTVRPTPGFMLTTTMVPDETHCVHNNEIYAEGEIISTDQPCEHCYCMRGDIVCAVQECSAQLENRGKQCKPRPPQIGQCCPDTYDCDIEGETTEESLSLTTTSPIDASTESDNINEIEDEGLAKPLPVTEHVDEHDKTTIVPIGQRFDATGESSTQSVLDDLSKLQDKLEITTVVVGFDEDIGMNTVVPFKIPGEGSCLIDGVTYTNGSKIPVTNRCDKSCVCLNSLPQCIPVDYDCTPVAEETFSETERSTEAVTETSTGATKSIDVEAENITELISEVAGIEPTEKEPTGTEQPESQTTEKESVSVQEATTYPSAPTEDKVTTEVAEEEAVTPTSAPVEIAKTQEPLSAEHGTQSPAEESTEVPVVEEIAVTQKVYTVGPSSFTEGISELTTIEPSGSTEASTEVGEPDELGTRGGDIDAHTPVEGLIPQTERAEETSTSLSEEHIPITDKAITPSEVQPEETTSESVEGVSVTEESVSVTQKSITEEEQTEISENITEQATTSAAQEEGTTKESRPSESEPTEKTILPSRVVPVESATKPVEGGDVTEEIIAATQEPSSEKEQTGLPEAVTEKGTTSAAVEEGTTVRSYPSEVISTEEVPQVSSVTDHGEGLVIATEVPTAEVTESTEKELESSEIPILGTRDGEIGAHTTPEGLLSIESHVTQKALTSDIEGISQVTEVEGVTSTPSSVEAEGATPTSGKVADVTTEEIATEVGATVKPSLEVQTTLSAVEEGTTKSSAPSEGEGEVTEKPVIPTVITSQEGAAQKPEEIPTAIPEIEGGTTSATLEEATTKESRPSEVEVTEKAIVLQESASEPVEGPGATEESILATEKPYLEEDLTEITEAITEQGTTSATQEEGTTSQARPTEGLTEKPIVPIQIIPQETVTEPAESSGATEESISVTQEGIQTEVPEPITEKGITSAVLEEGTTKAVPSEDLTEKPSVPTRIIPEEPVTESAEGSGATEESISATQEPSSEGVQTEVSEPFTERGTTSAALEEGTTKETRVSVTEKAVPEEAVSEPAESTSATEVGTEVTHEASTKQPLPIESEELIEQYITKTLDVTEKATTSPIEPIIDLTTTQKYESLEETASEPATETSVGITKAPVSAEDQKAPAEASSTEGIEEPEGVSAQGITEPIPVEQTTSTEQAETVKPAVETVTSQDVGVQIPTESATETSEKELEIPDILGTRGGEIEAIESHVTQVPTSTGEQSTEPTEKEADGRTQVAVTLKPSDEEIQTELSEATTDKGTTFAAEGTTKASSPSEEEGAVSETPIKPTHVAPQEAERPKETISPTEKPLAEEGQTELSENITERGTTSAPSEEGATKESLSSVTERILPEETASVPPEGIAATEPSVSATQQPSVESKTEVSENITERGTTSVPSEEAATKESLPSVTEKILPEETVSEPAEGIVATEPSVSATQKPSEETQTEVSENITDRGTTSAPSEEGATRESLPSVTEKTLPEEAASEPAEGVVATEPSVSASQKPSEETQTEVSENITERGTTTAPSVEGATKESLPSVTEKILPEETASEPAEGIVATEPSVSATQKPSNESQTEVSEYVTEKGTTSASFEEGATKESFPSVTEKILPEEAASEPAEGIVATEPSVSATQKPSEESQTEVTERGTTLAPSEEGATKESFPSVTEKILPEETASELAEGVVATEPSVSATQKPSEESQTEVTERGTTSAPSEEGAIKESFPSVTEKILPEETASEPAEGVVATEPSVSATQRPSEESQTEVTERGTTSAPSEEGATRESLPSVTEKILPEETASEPVEGIVATEPSVSATQKPSEESQTEVTERGTTLAPSEEGATRESLPSVTEKILPEETASEPVEGIVATEPSVSATQKPSEESQTEVTERGTTSAPSEEGATKESLPSLTEKISPEETASEPAEGIVATEPSVSATQQPSEESQTEISESITESGTTSAPSEEGATKEPLPSVTEKILPEETASVPTEGIAATEPSVPATQKPSEESQTEVSENITETGTTSVPSEEAATKEFLPSVTEKILPEETASEPAEEIVATEPSVSATQTPSEESQTEVTERGTTSAPSEEGATKESLPSVTERILPEETASEPAEGIVATEPSVSATQQPSEESQTEVSERGTTSAPSEEGATKESLPSVTERILPEETASEPAEGIVATEPSVSATQQPSEESQTEVSENITESGTTAAPSEEGATRESLPSVTEKILHEETASEPAEGIVATEPSVSATQQPSEESQTEVSENITERGTTSAPVEEGATKEYLPSVTEKVLPEETASEPAEGSGATEASVSETPKPSEESQTEVSVEEGTTKESYPSVTEKAIPEEIATEPAEGSGATEESISSTEEPSSEKVSESITERGTTVSSLEDIYKMTTIFDIISPPQTKLPQQIEDITLSSIETITSESATEVTKTPASTEFPELAATEKIALKGQKEPEEATQKGTDESATTQTSAELRVTETTEKESEISSEIPLGTRDGEIGALIPIESHVTPEVPTDVTEKEAATSTPSIVEAEGTTVVSGTEVSATQRPLLEDEEGTSKVSTDRGTAVEEGTTKASEIEVTEKTIVPIQIIPEEKFKEPVTEETVSTTQKPLSEEGTTQVPEIITAPEEGVTKESLPSEVTEPSVSEPAEGSGATEESVSATQKPLSEEVPTEVSESATEKGTQSPELEGTTKESRPSDIESEKISEHGGATLSSVELEEKFGGDQTTEIQKITTIFDIISPPQTIAPQPDKGITTTQRSIISEEGVSELAVPITESNVEVTEAAAATEPSATEKLEETPVSGATEQTPIEEVTQKEEVTTSATAEVTGETGDLTTVSAPSEQAAVPTEKVVPAGQAPGVGEEVTEQQAEGTTEKGAEGEISEGKPTVYATPITESPIIFEGATETADKDITKATEGTTLSSVDFEQKFGGDNDTEGLPGVQKITTILDIISPTKAPTPVHDTGNQTTVSAEEESEKEIPLTTEKIAVTEKEYISTKAPSAEQTTFKPTVSTSSEIPTAQYEAPGTSHYPGSSYLDEDEYGDEDQQAYGPGTCRYGGKLYVSAQQIPRDDPCDFCFCFRSDIICLQQSCPPPINGCHEEPINGFCCPRYECPVSMATIVNMTTSTTTTSTTIPPHFLHHAYKGAATKSGCQIDDKTYQVGDVVASASGPCMHCICGGDGQMKCEPKQCTPEPMLRQMIAITSRR